MWWGEMNDVKEKGAIVMLHTTWSCKPHTHTLSICTKDTSRYKYAALPSHKVPANNPPIGTIPLCVCTRCAISELEYL